MSIETSIIIPVKNEEKYIKKCLASVADQNYPQDEMEIIVVDGLSTDRTVELINEYQEHKPRLNIKILTNEQEIVPTALNLGIKHAKGDYIIRLDAHSEYACDYVSNCIKLLKEKPEVWNVGGAMRARGESFIGKAIALLHHNPFGLGGGKFHDEDFAGYVDTVYLGAFRKEVFSKVGLYDERLVRNQDIELNSRIRRAGGKIYLSPQIKSYYYNRDTIKGFLKQNFRNGLWNLITVKLNPTALSIRHFVPLLFVVMIILSFSLSLLGEVALIGQTILSAILGSYFLTALYFSISELKSHGVKYFLILPLLFFMLHFSYGLGSIYGLFRSAPQNQSQKGDNYEQES